MPRARNTDQIKLTRELRERLKEQTEPPNAKDCWIYNPRDNESQIYVEVAGQQGLQICSVNRVAWAFAHEHEVGWETVNGKARMKGCLSPTEEVITLCGTVGEQHTGRGQCVNPAHLGRGADEARIKLRYARRVLKQITEGCR